MLWPEDVAEAALELCRTTDFVDTYARQKTGIPLLYRGLRGMDVCCTAFQPPGMTRSKDAGPHLRKMVSSGTRRASATMISAAMGGLPGASDMDASDIMVTTSSGLRRTSLSSSKSFSKSSSKKNNQARAKLLLPQCPFFASADEATPGIVPALSKVVKFIRASKGDVLFRQWDRPKDCYVVVSGQVGIHIDKPRVVPGEAPVPAEEYRGPRSARMPHGKGRDGTIRHPTLEKVSSWSEETDFGKLVVILPRGTVIGERALQDDSRRAATVICREPCEFMVIDGRHYRDIVKASIDRMRFLDKHLPGAAIWSNQVACGELERHPAGMFREQTFEEGKKLLQEGLQSEPGLFVVRKGVVLLQRSTCASDNPAYRLAHGPLMRVSMHGVEAEERPGQVVRDSMAAGDGAPQTTVDRLEKGAFFCSMSALPVPGVEPFTAVVAEPGTVILMGSELCIRKLPQADLLKLRLVLVSHTKARLKGLASALPAAFDLEAALAAAAAAAGAAGAEEPSATGVNLGDTADLRQLFERQHLAYTSPAEMQTAAEVEAAEAAAEAAAAAAAVAAATAAAAAAAADDFSEGDGWADAATARRSTAASAGPVQEDQPAADGAASAAAVRRSMAAAGASVAGHPVADGAASTAAVRRSVATAGAPVVDREAADQAAFAAAVRRSVASAGAPVDQQASDEAAFAAAVRRSVASAGAPVVDQPAADKAAVASAVRRSMAAAGAPVVDQPVADDAASTAAMRRSVPAAGAPVELQPAADKTAAAAAVRRSMAAAGEPMENQLSADAAAAAVSVRQFATADAALAQGQSEASGTSVAPAEDQPEARGLSVAPAEDQPVADEAAAALARRSVAAAEASPADDQSEASGSSVTASEDQSAFSGVSTEDQPFADGAAVDGSPENYTITATFDVDLDGQFDMPPEGMDVHLDITVEVLGDGPLAAAAAQRPASAESDQSSTQASSRSELTEEERSLGEAEEQPTPTPAEAEPLAQPTPAPAEAEPLAQQAPAAAEAESLAQQAQGRVELPEEQEHTAPRQLIAGVPGGRPRSGQSRPSPG